MAAFGLYTHIQANRRRSVALVVGLFVLVYVLTFAFALLFRAFDLGPSVPGGAVQDYLRAAARDLALALSRRHRRDGAMGVGRLALPPGPHRRRDRVGGGRPRE